MVKFTENFWGEKFLGFDVLYHNMKYGQKSCNDFIEFIKERMLVEENYSKQLGKLSRQVAAYPPLGSFSPYWNVLKQSTEKDSALHQQMVLKLQELLKDIQKYLEEQSRKHKTMKDAEQETSNVVQAIQNLSTTLQKAKEAYLSRSQELEKLRKESGGPKDIERAETRLKKAAEDYRSQVEKYASMRQDFDRKMTNSSQHFQDLEEQHLQQMLEFASSYSRTLEFNQQTLAEICVDLRNQTGDLSIDRFLHLFVESKATGMDKPAPIEFEESSAGATPPPPPHVPSPTSNLLLFDGDENVSNTHHHLFHAPFPGSVPMNAAAVAFDDVPASTAVKEKKREGILRKKPHPVAAEYMNGHGDHVAVGSLSEKHENHQTTTNGTAAASKKGFLESRRKFPSLKNLFTTKSNDESKSSDLSCPDSSSDLNSSSNNFFTKKSARPDLSRATLRGSKWFFRSKKDPSEKEKEKENKKAAAGKTTKSKKKSTEVTRDASNTPTIAEDAKSESSFGSQPYDQSNASTVPQLDAEGFVIRPMDAADGHTKKRSDSYEQYKTSDSDSEEDDKPKKFNVVIKPPSLQPNHTGPAGDDPALRAHAMALKLGEGPGLGFSYTGGKRATTRQQEIMQRSTSMSSAMMGAKLNVFDPFGAPTTGSSSTDSPSSQQSFPIPPQKTGGSISSNPWDSTVDLSLLSQSASSSQFQSHPVLGGPPLPSRSSNLYSTTLSSTPTVAIPLAVAFIEKVSAEFHGADESRCRTRIDGDLILTFPSGVLQTLISNPNHPALSFCLTHTSLLENVLPNKHLVTQETQIDDGRITYTFNMTNLTNQLKKQAEAKAIPQPYQNIQVMKYHVMSSTGAQHAPIHLVCYWKQDERTTDMRIDFRRNASCPQLRGLQLALAIAPDTDVTGMTSMPAGDFAPHEHTAKWNILNPSTEMANVKARFEHPPASRGRVVAPISCSFQADGVLLSRVLFELACPGYQVSMVKMRVCSAKYVCEPE
ncbi:F-BAR domain only protein 2 [Hypsibius exemplaris]|uniref:F-BAR domain only protein 2 n=1 Tax=Hypsibius exemplaris TaxID=2072580 RepID=A0A1W0W9H8_HYPEX|nr:F-BAR domain only protein 2 [Hypsibius exemplaris]